jgi:hypothetical protein
VAENGASKGALVLIEGEAGVGLEGMVPWREQRKGPGRAA